MNLSIFQKPYEIFQFYFTLFKILFLKNNLSYDKQQLFQSSKKFLCLIWKIRDKNMWREITLRSFSKIYKKKFQKRKKNWKIRMDSKQ